MLRFFFAVRVELDIKFQQAYITSTLCVTYIKVYRYLNAKRLGKVQVKRKEQEWQIRETKYLLTQKLEFLQYNKFIT